MINLMYCGNSGVFDGMLISMLSIAKKTAHPIHCYIITMSLEKIDSRFTAVTPTSALYLDKMLKSVNKESAVTLVDITEIFESKMILSPNLSSSYTPYTLLRLFADEIPQIPKKIIYIDADTMAAGDINELFSTDITNYEFGGVVDYLGKWFIRKDYINAGVLLLNLEEIRKTGLFSRSRALICSKKLSFPDQDALNRLAQKKLYLPEKFNSQRRLYPDTVIQHFSKSIRLFPYFHTVNIKPWEVEKVKRILKINAYDDILDEYLIRKTDLERSFIDEQIY